MAKQTRCPYFDLTGIIFGELLVLNQIEPKWGQTYWLCRCSCGELKEVDSKHLRQGKKVSCGCIDGRQEMFKPHGMCHTKEYRAWHQMKQRCLVKTDQHYPDYGERGILVCEKWQKSFISFFEDMGYSPKGFSLDRIDNNGNYEPSNCRWADNKTQCRNKRTNAFVNLPITGELVTLVEAAERTGIKYAALSKRYSRHSNNTELLFSNYKSRNAYKSYNKK